MESGEKDPIRSEVAGLGFIQQVMVGKHPIVSDLYSKNGGAVQYGIGIDIESFQKLLFSCRECSPVLILNRVGRWKFDTMWIYRSAMLPKAEAKMRPGCKTGCSYVTNDLALLNLGPWTHAIGKPGHVKISCFIDAVVADPDIVTVVSVEAGHGDSAIAYGPDRGADRGCIIGSVVRHVASEHRMEASVGKARADPCIVKWSRHELSSQGVSFFIKIFVHAILAIVEGIEVLIAVVENRSLDPAQVSHYTVDQPFLKENTEMIAWLYPVEINLPGINICQAVRQLRVYADLTHGLVQRTGYAAANHAGPDFYRFGVSGNKYRICKMESNKFGGVIFINDILDASGARGIGFTENMERSARTYSAYVKNSG